MRDFLLLCLLISLFVLTDFIGNKLERIAVAIEELKEGDISTQPETS